MLRDIAVVRNRKKINGERLKKHRVALEYWDFEDNLGDFLAPVIVEWMLAQKGMNLQTICAGKKHLMAVGSILGLGRFDAVVWGSGVNSFENAAHVTEQKKYRKYDVRALRGPVSRQVMTANGYDCPELYGDPAILMPLIYPGERKKGKDYVVIEHYLKQNSDAEKLDIKTTDYRSFIDRMLTAEIVYSSSLHGIILAESYGIPAVFIGNGMEKEWLKYYDWYYATGRYDVKIASDLQQAKRMTPMELPQLDKLQEGLQKSFPYDLWK